MKHKVESIEHSLLPVFDQDSPVITPRLIAVAMRCCLLTGSYEDGTRSCDCKGPTDCHLHRDARESLVDHPKVVGARERNFVEYDLMKRLMLL